MLKGTGRALEPLWGGVIAAALVILTFLAAVALGIQEQEIITQAGPAVTGTVFLPTAAGTSISPATSVPGPTATDVPSPTSALPSPTAQTPLPSTPSPSATRRPTILTTQKVIATPTQASPQPTEPPG